MTAEKDTGSPVTFNALRFGPITVEQDKVINFVRGIPGFEGLKRYILIDHDAEGRFKWLQSIDDPETAFLLTDPNLFRPGYAVPLKKGYAEPIGLGDESPMAVLVMVTVFSEDKKVSLNLKGPLVFNPSNMSAMQCIVDKEDYPARFYISL